MPDITFFEVHFHEFGPTNTAPLLGRGGSASEVARRGGAGAERDPRVEADDGESDEAGAETDGGSGAPVVGLLVTLVGLAAVALAARRLFGGGDELAELEELDEAV